MKNVKVSGAALLLVLLAAAPGSAGDRIDIFDRDGRGLGYGTVDRDTGRVDLYDRNSRRLGYGTVSPDGRIEIFDQHGRRKDSGILRHDHGQDDRCP